MLSSGAALGVLEEAMRAALAASGARLLEAVLAGDGDGYAGPHVKCASGHQAVFAGRRPKAITTVLGPVRLIRAWYYCRECGHGFAPRDEQLGTAGTPLSPGLREMIARAGAEVPNKSCRVRYTADSVPGGRRQVSTFVPRASSPAERSCPCR
jgi:hypothetical protein